MQNPEELGAKLAEFETKHAALEKQLAESENHRKEIQGKLDASEKTFSEYKEEREKADKETSEKFEEYDEALKELKKARTVAETKSNDYRRDVTEKELVHWNADRVEEGKEQMTVDQVLKYEDALEIAMHSEKARNKMLKGADSEVKDMVTEVVKSLSTDTGAGGAIYIPPAFASRVEKVARDVNPLREYAMVIQTNIGKTQRIAQGKTSAAYFEDGTTSSKLVVSPAGTENAADVNIPKSIAQNVLVRNLIATHALSMVQLEDSGFSINDMLTEGVGMDFGVVEGDKFINGVGDLTGTGIEPDGLIVNAQDHNVTARVTIDNATLSSRVNYFGKFKSHTSDTVDALNQSADADAIVNFAADLETRYHPNARFVMHRTTLAQLRGMRASGTGQDGQFLVQDVLQNNLFMTRVLGYPVVLNDSMPTIASAAAQAGTSPVIFFGDIRMSYTVAQARGMRMLRDQYSAKPNTEFQFTSRHGGMPFMAEAGSVLYLKQS